MYQKYINKYNHKNTLVMITSYPSREGEAAKQNAVACYAGNLLSEYKNRKIVVLADIVTRPETYQEGNILVVRCWTPHSKSLYLDLVKALRIFDRTRDVLIQFEFNMLGSVIWTSLLPILVAYLRLIRKNTTVVQHQVIDDLTDLGGHLNYKKGSLISKLFNLGIKGFYVLLGLSAKAIIVHEETLKTRLSKYVSADKIDVISHGMALAKRNNTKRTNYRQKLGIKENDFVLLMFGYLTWYKGTDWIIKQVGELGKSQKNIKLIVAGGESATLKSKPHYRKFVQKVKRLAQKYDKNIIMTGFVPEEEVQSIFEASDLVVLPYRTMMSASGPLSFALKYKKPYILSNVLEDSFKNPDSKYALEKSDLSQNKLSFTLSKDAFEKRLDCFTTKGEDYKRAIKYVSILRKLRAWENIVFDYEKAIKKSSISKYAFISPDPAFELKKI